MKKYVLTNATAVLCAEVLLFAQTRAAAPNPQERLTADRQSAIVTLVGCLQREATVPGRRANIIERAGIMQDYLLTQATLAPPSLTDARTTGGPTPDTPVSTAGSPQTPVTGSVYKIEGIAADRLRKLTGKRVEVTGRIDEDDMREVRGNTGSGTAVPGTNARNENADGDTPEFEATVINEVGGICAGGR
jgi:hypothetical protein